MALTLPWPAPARAADGVEVGELVVAASVPEAQRRGAVSAARTFYDFWNTGDEAFFEQAVADRFTDCTLPPRRPQGQQGPVFAPRRFLTLLPAMGVAPVKQ